MVGRLGVRVAAATSCRLFLLNMFRLPLAVRLAKAVAALPPPKGPTLRSALLRNAPDHVIPSGAKDLLFSVFNEKQPARGGLVATATAQHDRYLFSAACCFMLLVIVLLSLGASAQDKRQEAEASGSVLRVEGTCWLKRENSQVQITLGKSGVAPLRVGDAVRCDKDGSLILELGSLRTTIEPSDQWTLIPRACGLGKDAMARPVDESFKLGGGLSLIDRLNASSPGPSNPGNMAYEQGDLKAADRKALEKFALALSEKPAHAVRRAASPEDEQFAPAPAPPPADQLALREKPAQDKQKQQQEAGSISRVGVQSAIGNRQSKIEQEDAGFISQVKGPCWLQRGSSRVPITLSKYGGASLRVGDKVRCDEHGSLVLELRIEDND